MWNCRIDFLCCVVVMSFVRFRELFSRIESASQTPQAMNRPILKAHLSMRQHGQGNNAGRMHAISLDIVAAVLHRWRLTPWLLAFARSFAHADRCQKTLTPNYLLRERPHHRKRQPAVAAFPTRQHVLLFFTTIGIRILRERADTTPASLASHPKMNGPRSDVNANAADSSPNGLDVLHTAVEARMAASSREEAALALVGLTTMTTAALPPSSEGTSIAASANDATPRPSAVGAHSSAKAARPAQPSTVVTPGSGGGGGGGTSSNKPRGKLTYVKGVGLVSGELSAELLATLSASASASSAVVPQTPADKNSQKDTSGSMKKGMAKRSSGAATATTVVTPAPTPTTPTQRPPLANGWTNDELTALVRGTYRHGTQNNWEAVASFVGTHRSAEQCQAKWEERKRWMGRWRREQEEEERRELRSRVESPACAPTGAAAAAGTPATNAWVSALPPAALAAVGTSSDADAMHVSANANVIQTPRVPEKMAKKKRNPGRLGKQPSASTSNASKLPITNSPKKKKKGTAYSREKVVTADGKRKGDWDDDETARLQAGIRDLGSNWKDIAERYVQTRTKQQCKSKNQKMVRSDGEDWHTQTYLTLKKVRRPLSEPVTKRALKVDGTMMEPAVRRAKASKKKGSRKGVDKQLEDLPSLPPLPPALPPALPPPQCEQKEQKEQKEEQTDSVDLDASTLDTGALKPPAPVPTPWLDGSDTSGRRLSKRRSKRSVADTGALKPPAPVPTPWLDGGDVTSGRRFSKRRPKRSVAEIRDEIEAKQDMKQLMTHKKAKVQEASTPKPASTHSKARVMPDGTGDAVELATKAKQAVTEKPATKKKKGSRKTVTVASAKKAPSKATAKSGKKWEYSRCTTPGCTRQRQGGCAGQCRKHFNADRRKAGLEGAKTYAKTCKREGCNKLKQWGFGEYCRAHFAEEQSQKGALCSVIDCKKLPVRGCDGMCTVHYKKHN